MRSNPYETVMQMNAEKLTCILYPLKSCTPNFILLYVVDLRSVILCGIESQACVQATVLDLLEKDYDVHIIADAVSARSMVDRYCTCLVT